MSREEAKTEIMQIYGSLSEEKKMALDVLMAQADGEKNCLNCKHQDFICEVKGCKDYKKWEQTEVKYIPKQAVLNEVMARIEYLHDAEDIKDHVRETIEEFTSVAIPSAEPKTGHCKDCKYFKYDSVEVEVDGISLIFSQGICSRWGDGCKTKEDGYCFMFEPQESEG